MDFIKEKIRVMTEQLQKLKSIHSKNIDYYYIEYPQYKTDNTPPVNGWIKADKSTCYIGKDTHYWLKMSISSLPEIRNKEYRLSVKTGREGMWDATNPQLTVYLNGKTIQALDTYHTWIPLECGQDYDVHMYLYTGMEGGNFDVSVSVDTVDLEIENLYYDIYVPYLCMCELEENDYNYIITRDALNKALLLLDLRDIYSFEFYESVRAVSDYLQTEFYEKICGNSEANVACIGHTHIDIAWLWTVAQTREKAQRSFSTMINLMKKYKDFIFMSSQPLLYLYVKENDPSLYAEIKKAVTNGQWEVEGAMWLEADTNLISGESLVRQIIYGKRFIKEEFGIDSKILWLPDVFGYSAALPQILVKSGVTKFFTTKIAWNETNVMPNDTFVWEGIDGSCVFALFDKEYNKELNPHNVLRSWNEYKNKSLTNQTLLTFGYADGGGGPTYEMLETYERMKYGIPGMPKTVNKKAGQIFNEIEQDFNKNSKELRNVPKWTGELYLEMHRGTYTSIGKNKKNNRKSELLYQSIENVCTMNMVINKAEYPEDVIKKNIYTILLNQFHDIIPGSSIKQVYDVTDREYKEIIEDGRKLFERTLYDLMSSINTEGGIFVYNPTPFEISSYVDIDGKTYYAEAVPAHGWNIIQDKEVSKNIIVDDKLLENDVIRIIFNDNYHIISVFDKEFQREIIPENSEANRIEVFEDYPRDFDAWEITNYYKQKMWIADNVSNVVLLKNGLRVERKYKNSTICQDIVLNNNSKRIDFITVVDWHEDHVLMKAAFPVDIRSNYATYDIQFGNVERPVYFNNSWEAAKFEVCGHKWADLSEADYGVSVLNDCKYGYSIEENIIKISLLKSATYPNPEADRGVNSFTYSLYPHEGDYRKGKTIKESYLLNSPLEAYYIDKNNGNLSSCYSMFSCVEENIVLETVKKAEDDDSVIVRLYDAHNKKTEVNIKANFTYKEVYLCDIMENNIVSLNAEDGYIKVPVKNYEIITLKFLR